jgi:hypothetical protein
MMFNGLSKRKRENTSIHAFSGFLFSVTSLLKISYESVIAFYKNEERPKREQSFKYRRWAQLVPH